ncbi:MAG: recombination mediator RecR [Desulfopila sp.]|jgi:recombination protein RecR|nr:recombination mediator RecR [Desulfopila sp.]
MQIVPPALERLIAGFSSLPGIGNKTATRLAMHVLRRPPGAARELAAALADLHNSIQLCSSCFAFSENDPCVICGDTRRSPELVCVVEQPSDLLAIEKTGIFRGHYHILHGVLSPVDGIGPEEIKTRELMARMQNGVIKEVLIATSSTVPGEATASYLIDKLHNHNINIKVTRLACGIPMGMDIKYADKHTLARAIEGRLVAI